MSRTAAPFDLDGDRRGALCIHGFTGTPYEMAYLGRRLHERKMTVWGLLLPGHGTRPADLHATTWRDWFGAVEAAFDRLRARCPGGVAIAGQSLGGLLALHLAARRGGDVAAVAALSVPLWLGPLPTAIIRLARKSPVLTRLVGSLPKLGGSDVSDRDARRQNLSYRTIPLPGLLELADCMDVVRSELGEVRVPTLVLHGSQDHTAPPACAEEIVRRLTASRVRKRVLLRSRHLITLDVERDVVAAEVGSFFEAALGPQMP